MYDVVVVGGGAAGLSAALVLGRARRRVAVIDAGEPRNAPAVHMQGFLSRDGMPPAAFLSAGRAEVAGYGVELIDDQVADVEAGFSVRLAGGPMLTARRILVATGVSDELPDITGVRERWGRDLLHCPYCHGWEVRDQPLGVLGTHPGAVMHAQLVRQWSDDVVFFTHTTDVSAKERAQLDARGIRVVDGEIVVPATDDRGLDFDALLQRIHPAESRVRRLSVETPASFVAFDLLALGDDSLLDRPLSDRHRLLIEQLASAAAPIYLCPSTTDAAVAQHWFTAFEGAGLDGVVAKRLSDPYTPDKRTLIKVKHQRTADCVIAGYRIHKDGNGVGSLLLGLYDDDGDLHHVGVVASFSVKRRAELLAELEPLTHNALDNHPWKDWAEWMTRAEESGTRMPGGGSRWNAGKDLRWVPLRIERVAEVTFGQLQEGRFRHGSQFLRWRPDRVPESCRYSQLEVASPVRFGTVVERST